MNAVQTHCNSGHFEMVAKQTSGLKHFEHVAHKKRMKHRCREFNVAIVSGAGKVGEVAGSASVMRRGLIEYKMTRRHGRHTDLAC